MNKDYNRKKMTTKLAFKKQDSIGGNDAADDKLFLLNCFVDLGDLDHLASFSDPKCILLGRTGSGKTALVTKLKADHENRVIFLDPEALAMQYITNSSIVKHLIDTGLDLNTFFKYLWRHQICIEIFTKHQRVTSETDYLAFTEKIRYEFKKRNPKHLKALDYLEEWKDNFWKTSDSHVTAMITKTENEVSGAMGLEAEVLSAKLNGKNKFSSEEQRKFEQRGQSIVNDLQMKEVTGLLDMLDDFISLHQSRYYIVLDKLDEKWVGNDIRHSLIKSLIETAKELNRLESIKPVIVLREDLLERVFNISRDSGFQAEKYHSLYLHIKWSRSQLIDMINSRLNFLLEARYSKKKKLTYDDVLPTMTAGVPTIDYILDRTLMRPRDVIEFINFCIKEVSLETGIIDEDAILDAESEYSQSRLNALAYEWYTDYPGIKKWIKILKNRNNEFKVESIEEDLTLTTCLDYLDTPPAVEFKSSDVMLEFATLFKEEKISIDEVKKRILHIFYRIGLIGIKNKSDRKVAWSQNKSFGAYHDDIVDDTVIIIHPAFYSVLNTKHQI